MFSDKVNISRCLNMRVSLLLKDKFTVGPYTSNYQRKGRSSALCSLREAPNKFRFRNGRL